MGDSTAVRGLGFLNFLDGGPCEYTILMPDDTKWVFHDVEIKSWDLGHLHNSDFSVTYRFSSAEKVSDS